MRAPATILALVLLASCASRDSAPADSAGTPAPPAAPPARDTVPAAGASGRPPVTEPPSRGDGRLENPPIHRTNPRDEDVMNPGARAGAGGDGGALLAEIQRLARADGCSRSADCRTLPVGRKACGGPRSYVVYCAATTDEAALKRKIAELDALDRAAATAGAVSDCSLALAPVPVATGGVCRGEPGPGTRGQERR